MTELSAAPQPSVAERALAQAEAGDGSGAVQVLNQHLAAEEDDVEAWIALGMLLGRSGQGEEARAALAHAVGLDGDVVLARVLLARALEQAGKLDDAVFQLLRAAKLDQDNPGVLRELGNLFYKKQLYDKALQWLMKARAVTRHDGPEEARALYAIGLVQEARRDPGAAIVAYREAIRLDPEHLDARKTLADALAGIGEHTQAVEVLDDLLRVDRTNEKAAVNKEVLERALVEMRQRRLLGKSESVLEASALVQAGQMKRRGREARYGNALSELYVTVAGDGTICELFLVLPDPGKASETRDAVFQVTVVAKDGSREPANYATAVSLTFLREALGVPMTRAGELYARLLGGQKRVESGGGQAGFATREQAGADEPLNGLRVAYGSG